MPGYAHRVQNIGGRYFEYDAAGNIIVEQDGKIDLEDSSKCYKIEQIDENKYIADSAWGYYTDEDRENNKTKVYRRTYEWDDKNQLIKSQDDNVTVCYTYGSDGQRASKYTENSETLYTNNFWVFHVSGSVRNGAGIINKNIYLGKMRVVTKVKEAYDAMEITERQCQYFYHSDHLGSAQLVTDNKGNEYQRIEYTPYGETWIDLKATQNDLVKLNYKFTAKELDEETGLYYYGARYLNPKYSMWLSADPALGEYIPQAPVNDEIRRNNQNLPGMGGIFNHINSNLYHYAGNNPVKYVDPTGAYSVDDENKTITADIDDYRDLLAARNAFFELEKQGFKCQALNKDGDGVEFSTARDMFDFVDFINPDKPKLMSVEDIISLMGNISAITSDATKLKYPTLAKCTNVASVILNAGSLVLFDLSQAINNPNWDTISDAVITAVGFIPGYGTYISLGLSASKVAGKGIYRFSTDFINFSIHLQENLANYYCEQTFGYRPF